MLQASVTLPRFNGYGSDSHIENVSHMISKDRRYRGMARLTENETVINLHHVRAALDAITLDDAQEVEVPCRHVLTRRWITTYRNGKPVRYSINGIYTFRPAPDREGRAPRVKITAPCGETRTYSVRLLDRMLSEFGA